MKTITKYVAYDGAEFTDAERCQTYENNSHAADAIIAQLSAPPDKGCEFVNGHGYLQHGSEQFYKVRRELLQQALKECDNDWIRQSLADDTVHPSWAYRIIGEACTRQLSRAWSRIMCTDPDLREWGQPYYAAHPDQAPGKHQLN